MEFGVYVSQLIRFAKASSHVADFNTRNNLLTEKLLPALHYSVDFIYLSFGIMGFIVELWNY